MIIKPLQQYTTMWLEWKPDTAVYPSNLKMYFWIRFKVAFVSWGETEFVRMIISII